jgi:hypothetical protein
VWTWVLPHMRHVTWRGFFIFFIPGFLIYTKGRPICLTYHPGGIQSNNVYEAPLQTVKGIRNAYCCYSLASFCLRFFICKTGTVTPASPAYVLWLYVKPSARGWVPHYKEFTQDLQTSSSVPPMEYLCPVWQPFYLVDKSSPQKACGLHGELSPSREWAGHPCPEPATIGSWVPTDNKGPLASHPRDLVHSICSRHSQRETSERWTTE